jgi:dihydrofolate reductase
MRKVTYGGACSLDGFIAGQDGAVDWLHFSRDVQQIMKDYWKNIDTVLLGRKTFEASARSGGGAGSFGDIKAYVFSRTLDPKRHPDVQIISEDAGTFVRRLKQSEGKDICVMGGGELARSLFDAGAIDEVGFNIHPVLLGSGVPAFLDMARRTQLELLECRRIDGGCVYVTYRVK